MPWSSFSLPSTNGMESSESLNTSNKNSNNFDGISVRSSTPFQQQLNRTNSRNSTFDSANVNMTTLYHQVEIRQRDSFKFFVRADEPLETLHFSFYTRKKSIGFGLFYLYLPNLSNEFTAEETMILPLEKVKDLIGSSKENVRMQKMGQEGTLGRALSTNNKNSKKKKKISWRFKIFLFAFRFIDNFIEKRFNREPFPH